VKTKKPQATSKGKKNAKCGSAKKASTKNCVESESDTTVTINRRKTKDRRTQPDRRKKCEPVAVERRTLERRAKVNRRRQIDPTTCERDYTPDEIEFMNAMEEYKRASGRMFPTCSEVLEVIKTLGYEKRPKVQLTEPQYSEPALNPELNVASQLEGEQQTI